MIRRTMLLAGATMLVTMPAVARDYYYFNKPGVTRDQYVADKLECDRLTGGVQPVDIGPVYVQQSPNLTAGQNALAVGIASLFAGLMGGGENRKAMRAVERTCMADKGYARYQVDKPVVREIEKIADVDARIDRYFALAATDAPVGARMKE
jgi:hypothetical protein